MAQREESLYFKLKSTFSGEGFIAANAAIRKTTKEFRTLTKIAGEVGGTVGSVAASIFQGGIWDIGARAIGAIVNKFDEMRKAAKDAAEAFEKKRVEAYFSAIDKGFERVGHSAKTASESIAFAAKARNVQIEKTNSLILAQLELERQKRLATGEDKTDVNRDIANRSNLAMLAGAEDSAAAKLDAAREEVKAAEDYAARTGDALKRLLADRAKLEGDMAKAAESAWRANNALAHRSGFRLKAENMDSYMADDKTYQEMKGRLAELDKRIATARKSAAEAENRVSEAGLSAEAAAARLEVAKTKVESEKIRQRNEEESRIVNAYEEQKKKEEEAQKAADERLEAEARANDALIEESKRKFEEEQRKRKAEEDKDRKEKAKKDIELAEQRKNDNLKKLGEELTEAQRKRAQWEMDAQRARGVTFGEWQRGERDLARDKRIEGKKQENRVSQVDAEIARLEKDRRRGRGFFDARKAQRLDDLRRWRDQQDPANNPFDQNIKKINDERDRLIRETKTEITNILKLLQEGGNL